jgi:hypothetical protein
MENINKYKSKLNGKVAIIISNRAAGVCDKTLGTTMIVFKYENDNYDYPLIMEYKQFYREHSEITES